MPSSRKISIEFASVFLIGMLVGGLVVWLLTDTQLSQFMTRTNDPEVLVTRINQKYAQEYQLTPEELTRIQPLVAEMAAHVVQVRRRFGVDVVTTLDDYHQKIAAQLNPEHRAAYEQASAARKKALSSMLMLDTNSPSSQQGPK